MPAKTQCFESTTCRRDGHRARVGEDDAEQVRLRLALGVESAFVTGGPGVEAAHGPAAIEQFDLAVQAVAAQVHQLAASFEDPVLDPAIRRLRPVFRMRIKDKDAIGVKIERAVVELGVGVEVVAEALALEPAEQAPLGRGEMTGLPALDRIGAFRVFRNVVVRLGPVERQRREQGGALPFAIVAQLVARQIGLGVDDRPIDHARRHDVVAAAAEGVVRIPGVRRGQHRDRMPAVRGATTSGKEKKSPDTPLAWK